MPLFSRSSERKHKSPRRFSFRKHEGADALASSSSSVRSSASSSSSTRRARDGRAAPPAPVHKPPPAPVPVPSKPLSASVASVASTTGSSVSSSRLSASVRSSTSTARSTSPTIIESLSGDTDTGSDTEIRDSTEDDPRMAATRPRPQHGSTSSSSARSVRNSLVDYRQLQCSMSYKNRLESQQRSVGVLRSSEDRPRGSMDEPQYVATTPSSVRSSSPPSAFARSSSRISEVPSEADHADDDHRNSSVRNSRNNVAGRTSSASFASGRPPRPSEDASAPDRRSEVRMTEANVAAMQTRRAFQQMALAMKGSSSDDEDLSDEDLSDEDEDEDEDDASDSDSSSFGRFPRRTSVRVPSASSSSVSTSSSSRHGVVRLGADEYRKFQFRLRQLEDLCQEQARKQAFMEEAIEREVELRTRKVVAAMDKKIEMYRQAKALECEREVARRVSEMEMSTRGSSSSMRRSMMLSSSNGRPSYSSLSSIPDSELKGKPLEKIFHPRRARARKVERLRELEEQQKREMEQFRAFIQSTEGARALPSSPPSDDPAAVPMHHADVDELLQRDPPPTAAELAELVAVLRRHVDVQEKQLDDAKQLISAAIDAREEAERMAEEAVALTVQLDSRLDRAGREMTWVRDELRRSMSLPPEEFSARASRVLSAPLFFAGRVPETEDEPAEEDEDEDEDEDKRDGSERIAAAPSDRR